MSTQHIFHHFPALPIELRLKIWSLALSIPRTILISCKRAAIIRGTPRRAQSWNTDASVPPLLHVNRESRYEALAVYSPHFTTPSHPRPIYLCFAQDVVRFGDGVLPYIPHPTLLEIQRMVVETQDCAYFGFYNMQTLTSMEKLKEVDIFAERGWVYREDNPERYIDIVLREFEEAREANPGWECPIVRIFEFKTGKDLRFFKGGAKIPGWVPEETSNISEEEDGVPDIVI